MENRQVKEKKFWDKFAFAYDRFIEKAVDKTYVSIIENMGDKLNKSFTVLEIGTGTGVIPFSICTRVLSVIAIDISPAMIRIAKQKQALSGNNNIDFQVMDSYRLAFPDQMFDVVIASNLLHLLYEPDKPLNEVKRVLKEDGIFIAPTFCVGENRKSRMITRVAEVISGFRIINKWSISEYKNRMIANGWVIINAVSIDGRFPLSYLVMKNSSSQRITKIHQATI